MGRIREINKIYLYKGDYILFTANKCELNKWYNSCNLLGCKYSDYLNRCALRRSCFSIIEKILENENFHKAEYNNYLFVTKSLFMSLLAKRNSNLV